MEKSWLSHFGLENDFEEEDSDKCMVDLMNPNNKCQFEKCWDKMAKMGTSRYYNTHQLLWFLLGDKVRRLFIRVFLRRANFLKLASFFFHLPWAFADELLNFADNEKSAFV